MQSHQSSNLPPFQHFEQGFNRMADMVMGTASKGASPRDALLKEADDVLRQADDVKIRTMKRTIRRRNALTVMGVAMAGMGAMTMVGYFANQLGLNPDLMNMGLGFGVLAAMIGGIYAFSALNSDPGKSIGQRLARFRERVEKAVARRSEQSAPLPALNTANVGDPKPVFIGVCAKLAKRLNVPVTAIRAALVILTVSYGFGLPLYFLAAVLLAITEPKEQA